MGRNMPRTDPELTIPFTCPHCGLHTDVGATFAGETGPCVGCGNTITVSPLSSHNISGATRAESPSSRFPIIKISMVVVGLLSLCVLGIVVRSVLQPALRSARDGARCAECESKLRRIGQALEDYHNKHNRYPPAVVYDENGTLMHSWRVLILPYLGPEAERVHEMYDMEKPWDSNENLPLIQLMPNVYHCPADAKSVMGETSYLAVVGTNTVINNDRDKTTTRWDITDVSSETMVVLERAGSAFSWIDPKDIPMAALRAGLNSNNPTSPGSEHIQGVNILMADQSIVRLSDAVSSEDLRGLATIGGNEYIEALEELAY